MNPLPSTRLDFQPAGAKVSTRARGKIIRSACLLVLFSCLFACKTSDDAIAAAQQMTTTAADLSRYYDSLADSLSDTIALNELDAAFSKVPFDDHSRQLIQDTRSEITKRKEMAQALAHLAESMSALSSPTLSSGVATAASSLGDDLVQVKALPAGPPIPDIIGKASSLLMQVVQQRKEREAARAMDQTLAALSSFFEKEKGTYDSIFRTNMFLASQVAKDLINRQVVEFSPMLAPAFRPFNLTALPADGQTRDTLRTLALSRLGSSADEAKDREMKASSAMLAALQEMSARTHLLAAGKPIGTRGNPVSLNVVESWVASANLRKDKP